MVSSISFATDEPKDISCEEVISTLSSDNKVTWEEFDSNWVRWNNWTDYNKWELRYWSPALSNNWICMYNWKITNVFKPLPNNPYQFLIYNKDWELVYYALRPITKSLLQEEENYRKKNAVSNNQIIADTKANNQSINNNHQNNLDDYNKSIEDARKIIEQKKSSIAVEEKKTLVINESKITKKLSPANERKAVLLKKRIQLLKKQLEILEKQLESL